MQSIARHMPDAGMQSARMQSISRRTVGAGMLIPVESIARHRTDAKQREIRPEKICSEKYAQREMH